MKFTYTTTNPSRIQIHCDDEMVALVTTNVSGRHTALAVAHRIVTASDELESAHEVRKQLVAALQGALVDDLLPYHSAEWIAKARAALAAAKAPGADICPVCAQGYVVAKRCDECGIELVQRRGAIEVGYDTAPSAEQSVLDTIRHWMGENDVVLSAQAYRTLVSIVSALPAADADAVRDAAYPFQFAVKNEGTELWLVFENGAVCLNNVANNWGPITGRRMSEAISAALARHQEASA